MTKKEFNQAMKRLQANTAMTEIAPEERAVRLETFWNSLQDRPATQLERAIDWLLNERRQRFFPVLGELLEALETVWSEKQFKGRYRCMVCYDTGQISAPFLVTWNAGHRTAERLTEDQAKKLLSERGLQLRIGGQMVYWAYGVPCACRARVASEVQP
jgi:hypothetical protein